MNTRIRNKTLRVMSLFLGTVIFVEALIPTAAFALTSGPSQPEVQSFEPVTTTDMVDLFTGDFTYNIPLFELPGPNGGYPFNLAYNAGVTMDQEASWVGLGWNLNPGAITRQMRGFPDEFNGATVIKEQDIKPNVTFGAGVGADLEVFGAALKEIAKLSLGIGVYYNNYKGVGYSIEPSLSFHTAEKSGMGAGVGLNLSLDSQEGVGANASLSLSDKNDNSTTSMNVGIGYNSKAGLTSLSMGVTASNSSDKMFSHSNGKEGNGNGSMGGSSRLSLAGIAYSPSVGMPMQGRNISLTFKAGGAAFGAFGNGYINGFFSTQYLKDKSISNPAYGYLYLQNATADNALMDFNREKDGMIRKTSPNLAIPAMTNDIYNVAGQGIAGMYRPFRSDIGILKDARVESNTVGGSAGVDIGPGPSPHIGVQVTVNYSENISGKWDYDNLIKFGFKSSSASNLLEPAYFKIYGEKTSDATSQLSYINGAGPVRIDLNPTGSATARKYEAMNKFAGSALTPTNPDMARERRAMVVSPVNNDYNQGLYVVNADGATYRYARPAFNNKQVEAQFTVGSGYTICETIVPAGVSGNKPDYKKPNTDQFFNRTTLPSFAHSYLLTEILGADYVDADGDGVPSDGDFGYWVKFTYNKTSTNYKWRVPFLGANYQRGLNTTFEDDKGAYMYGEKEMYYLQQATTKTHIAVFSTSARQDAYGAGKELQDPSEKGTAATFGDPSYKLDQIKLFTKAEYAKGTTAKPIQTVNFEYTYDLCKGLPNNRGLGDPKIASNAGGKLTLKKVYFTYENNTRGSLNPYIFDYNESVTAENPNYNTHLYDRWGNYKPSASDCNNQLLPYVEQFANTNTTKKQDLNRNVSAWNLKKITMPSGAKIAVDYEADDYGYIQNKVAMQMFKIASVNAYNVSNTDQISSSRNSSGATRRIYFDLEYPLSTSLTAPQLQTEIDKYFDNTGKLYFRAYMKLRKAFETPEEFVSGYADIADKRVDLTSAVSGNYTRGYVELQDMKGFHPFQVAAWQHIRTNAPALTSFGPYNADPNSNTSAMVNKLKSLVSIIPTLAQTFVGFRTYAHGQGWAEKIASLDRSVIRLNSPDRCKFGGGIRVKQITLSDEWDQMTGNAETKSNYGQVYDYTILEGGVNTSSGVAAYEPMVGGDEIALRSVKEYPEKIPLKTDNNLFFELPVNEGYYPGPHVGYRKVRVTSLASYYSTVNTDDVAGGLNIPAGIMTTGAAEHEFYTAKDFPVVTQETDIDKRTFDLFIPIPLIGQITVNNMTASQGYSIQLNDMHGKLKKVSYYRQDKNGALVMDPVSWVKYNYKADVVKKDGNPANDYYVLNNSVPVITGDSKGIVSKTTKLIGQDYEFFTDMRQNRTFSTSGGARVNTDIIIIPPFFVLPAFVPWPNVGTATNEVRTVVTNKIVHSSGILVSTEAYNEGSLITTENKVFDDITGQPLLTTVTNNFDDPIFNYKVPAYFNYTGMGAAYENIGFTFNGTLATTTTTNQFTMSTTSAIANNLFVGDELLIGGKKSVIYEKSSTTVKLFSRSSPVSGTSQSCVVVRSGKRNVLNATAASISTLGSKTNATQGDPTVQSNRLP